MKKILVLCTGNSCRSQIAEGYLKYFAQQRAQIYSAGVETHGLNPLAVATMLEDGLDISKQTSNHIDEYKGLFFDIVLTVCDHAKESCPFIPNVGLRLHHNFTDPSKLPLPPQQLAQAFAHTRDEIKAFCAYLVDTYL